MSDGSGAWCARIYGIDGTYGVRVYRMDGYGMDGAHSVSVYVMDVV